MTGAALTILRYVDEKTAVSLKKYLIKKVNDKIILCQSFGKKNKEKSNIQKKREKKLTSSDPHTEAVATVQMIDTGLLEVTSQASAPTATDVKSFRLKPARVIVRIPAMVEHP